MQFVCDQCKMKYEIDEARVRGKSLKIRCRACGNVVDVRDPGLSTGARGGSGAARPPKPPGHPPGRKAGPSGGTGTLGERFQRAFEGRGVTPPRRPSGAPPPGPAQQAPVVEEATHIIVSPLLAGADKQAADVSRKLARWHVAIRNQPMGPMSEEAIRRHVEDGAVTAASLVWREGFDEWVPLRTVVELGYLLEPSAGGAAGRVAMPIAGSTESLFDLPPAQQQLSTTSIVPPPGILGRQYLIPGIVGVVSFALGMLFMYVISGSGAQQAIASPEPVLGPSEAVEPSETTGQPELPTLQSGSLTITLTNPTVVVDPTGPAGVEPSPRTPPNNNSGRPSGRQNGRDGGTGVAVAGSTGPGPGPAPYVPGRDLGSADGGIRTSGPAPIAIGGGEARPLSADKILPVVQAGQGGIQICYNQARQRDLVLDLSMRLTIEISPDGSVRNVTLTSSDYVSGELNDCIAGRVRGWQFPRATATSRVVLPFAFHQR